MPESTGGTATMETTQLETKVKPTDEHLAADRTFQEITSAGYHLRDVKCATLKYNISWESCEKNPGHEGFIPLHEFSSQHLPPRFQRVEILHYIKRWADLTVRLRVSTSMGATKTGTAYINSVVRLDKDCICRDCKRNGYKDRKWWCINLNGAAYCLDDNWEAENTRVDFFHDTEDHRKNGVMKTLRGVKMMGSTGAEDVCLMMCATHDDDLGLRLQRRWEQAIQLSSKFGSKTTVGCEQAPSKVLVCISHPHGAPKQVTVGELIQQEDIKNEVPEDVSTLFDQHLKYTTKTCPGSGGAILLCLDDLVSEDISARFSSSCIHLFGGENFNFGLCRRVVSLERYLSLAMQKNLVKSMLGATRSCHAEPDEKSEMVRPKLIRD